MSKAQPLRPPPKHCGACRQEPYPTYAYVDVAGEAVAVCSSPEYCRRRATAQGIWCR